MSQGASSSRIYTTKVFTYVVELVEHMLDRVVRGCGAVNWLVRGGGHARSLLSLGGGLSSLALLLALILFAVELEVGVLDVFLADCLAPAPLPPLEHGGESAVDEEAAERLLHQRVACAARGAQAKVDLLELSLDGRLEEEGQHERLGGRELVVLLDRVQDAHELLVRLLVRALLRRVLTEQIRVRAHVQLAQRILEQRHLLRAVLHLAQVLAALRTLAHLGAHRQRLAGTARHQERSHAHDQRSARRVRGGGDRGRGGGGGARAAAEQEP
jgi:hypothetical protein